MGYREDWSKIENFVNSSTQSSLKKMYLMSTDHIHKLMAEAPNDAVIQDILTFVQPAYSNFVRQYRAKTLQINAYRLKTLDFTNMAALLSSEKIRRWDVEIQMIYDDRSNQYQSLLPNGRAPFQKGAYEMRIESVMTLGEALSMDPQLATLGGDILAFGQQLELLRQEQQGDEGQKSIHSASLEALREELATVLFGAFGRLVGHYYRELHRVTNFYELKYFRRRPSSSNNNSEEEENYDLFEFDLAPQSRVVKLEGLLAGGETIRLQLLEGDNLQYYTVANSADTPDQVYRLQNSQNARLQLPLGHRLLVLENSENSSAKVEVEILEDDEAPGTN